MLRVQLSQVVDFTVDQLEHGQEFGLTVMKHYAKRLVIPREEGEELERESQPCGAGKGYLMIDQEGDIWPCHRFDGADEDIGGKKSLSLGNIGKPGFNHDLQRSFLDHDHFSNHKEQCTTCPVNEICGGYCPAANVSSTGSLYKPHDAFCHWTQLMYEAAEELVERARRDSDVWRLFNQSLEGVQNDGQR